MKDVVMILLRKWRQMHRVALCFMLRNFILVVNNGAMLAAILGVCGDIIVLGVSPFRSAW